MTHVRNIAVVNAFSAGGLTVLAAGLFLSTGPASAGAVHAVPLAQWVVVAVVATGIGLGWYLYATRGLRPGRVSRVEGAIHKEEPMLVPLRGSRLYRFSFTIGAHRFTGVPARMYDGAPDSGRVRLYSELVTIWR